MKTVLFGGDERQIYAASYLKKKGHDASIYAIDRKTLQKYGAKDLFTDSYNDAEVIVFPLPFSRDGATVNCPFMNGQIFVGELFKKIKKGTRIFAGMAGAFAKSAAREYGHELTDYYDSEELQIRNAVPTAEGAIWTYMNNSRRTMFGSRFIVSGFGKVGKCLADRLYKLGGKVTAAVRGEKDVAIADAMGIEAVLCDDLTRSSPVADCIFNTVPCNIFSKEFVSSLRDETIYIELASKPFGMGRESAAVLGARYVAAPSLPGKTAPATSGEIIGNIICKYL